MSQQVEAIAAKALREWLLLQLPAKVTELNAARAAVIKCPRAGPFTFSSDVFSVTVASGGTVTQVTVNGALTSTQVAAAINSAVGSSVAAVDSDDRWYITSTATPSTSAPSYVAVGSVSGSDSALSVMGWSIGGQEEYRAALLPPTANTIFDGRPVEPDFGAGMLVMIDDRRSGRTDFRKDIYEVELDVTILVQDTSIGQSRSRDQIQSTVRAVREVLSQDRGRQLGREAVGDIVRVVELSCEISGAPFKIKGLELPNDLFDAALMKLNVTVHERPSST